MDFTQHDVEFSSENREAICMTFDVTVFDHVNTDILLAKIILPIMQHYRDHTFGFPTEFETKNEYIEVLDKIITAFKIIATEKLFIYNAEQVNLVEEGLKLFSEQFLGFWY